MILGIIADDFTGASDIAAMLARGGMSVELQIGVPSGAGSTADTVVVALKSRSIPAADAVAQSLAAFDWLEANGARQFIFKYCSTFDSTPAGNIGSVGEALASRLGATGVVACPAFPENGRVVFNGHLFVKGKLLSESGLENHPLNPMTDPDIRRWLRRQTKGEVGLVDYAIVQQGAAAIAAALSAATEPLVIVDATADADLMAIGRAAADAKLITGGSGIAMALPGIYRERGLLSASAAPFAGSAGPGVILSGSCSPMTQRQVAGYAANHPSRLIAVEALLAGEPELDALVAFAAEHRGKNPLLYSTADPAEVARLQQQYGRETVAARLDGLFGDLACRLRDIGFGRLVIAGGETSGAVVSALGIKTFALGPEIAPGVPALVSHDEKPLAMALKSGNFGGPDFFTEALEILHADA